MSIPGESMEEPEPQPVVNDGDPTLVPQPEPEDDDAIVETVSVGGNKMAPVSEVIKYRKQAKETARRLAELEPQIQESARLREQLQQIQPALEVLQRLTPQQREALATGKMPSPVGTPQQADDAEARQWAEMNGFIAADGSLDIARARQNLDWLDRRHEQQTEQRLAPLRQTTAQQTAQAIMHQAFGFRDAAGNLMASQESIREAYAMLPPELAANPNVAITAVGTAMVIDRMKGRTPKAPEMAMPYGDPLYSEPAAGRRGPVVTAEDRALAKRVGLTDQDLTGAVNALTTSRGRGVRME